jgi:hypothetical protein
VLLPVIPPLVFRALASTGWLMFVSCQFIREMPYRCHTLQREFQGGFYAELLADTEFQPGGERKAVKAKQRPWA